MSSHGHSKTVCIKCNGIITQCRCMAKDKVVKHDMCNRCQKELVAKEIEKFEEQHFRQERAYWIPLEIFKESNGSLIVLKHEEVVRYFDRVINPDINNEHYIGPVIQTIMQDEPVGLKCLGQEIFLKAGYYFYINDFLISELPEDVQETLYEKGYAYVNKSWEPKSFKQIDHYFIKEL